MDLIQAKAQMLIRSSVNEVFEAFTNPAITSQFWFTRGSATLAPGAHVQWDWEMYGVSIPVDVKVLEPQQRIVIEWPGYGALTQVTCTFTPHGTDATFVTIVNAGFSGDDAAIVSQALDATEGFTLVLAGAKAWLEHGVRLNLVADHAPAGPLAE